MILEFSFDYASSSLVYEKILLREIASSALEAKIAKHSEKLFLYVVSEDAEALQDFATKLSLVLPHSIFLGATDAKVVDEMPDVEYVLPQTTKLPLPFCPQCLEEIMDEANENYYNIFHECEVCGYSTHGKSKNYKEFFVKASLAIKEGLVVELQTFYGKFFVGRLSEKCNDVNYDILSFDLFSIEKYTNATNSEVVTLGAIEKPLVRLKTNLEFKKEFENIQAELIRFKLPDDFVLHLLMAQLHAHGIDLIFLTKEAMVSDEKLILMPLQKELEPIECVVSDENIIILKGEKGLPNYERSKEFVIPHIGAFFSVIKEHSLQEKTVAGVNLSEECHNDILIYSKKFGTIEYLSFAFSFTSMKDVFDTIGATNETGAKLIENYKNKYSEHFEEISAVQFYDKEFNVHKLWGIVSIVLGFSKSSNLSEASQILQNNATSFLGSKGSRIDYKLKKIDSKVYLDPLMTIRTAMSFRLAEVDALSLSYGVVESFAEFISTQLDEIKEEMKIEAVTMTGSLLGNRHLFSKLNSEVSLNHNVYFNKELPVDGINIQFGGNELF
ncbi:MAG: hydrogenase [Helicobacteraceae bacterium CG2_30_36_10]|nr:MAG: hydrogenase [Helicobacteraceae bacterium CG2_30_36_10]